MKNVLLVDDDKIFNLLNTKMLRWAGLANEIDTAENGEQALALLNSYYAGNASLPDVILLDLSMPVMDGFTFIEAFRMLNLPNKEKVSIIIVTSSENPRDLAKARALGITKFLTKPVSEQDLISALQTTAHHI